VTIDAAGKPVDDRKVDAMITGAKYGAIVGLMIAQVYMSFHSAVGYHIGSDMVLVFLVSAGLCALIGAAVGWLNVIPGEP
jgi:ABC-type branched-subunit amino acid transport system permease subunit